MDDATLLFFSVEEGNSEKFREILETVSIDVTDNTGDTLLHAAAAYGQHEIAGELIEREIDLNHQGKQGKTALHYALEMGDNEMASLLISAGADPTVSDEHGNQPLWSAVMNEEVDDDVIQSLVQNGADPANQNEAGTSPLDLARRRGNTALIEDFTTR